MELTPKEQYEARRAQEKSEKIPDAPSSAGTPRRYLWWIIALLIVGGIGYALYAAVKKEIPASPDKSVAYDIVSRTHIAQGATHIPYNSNPPTSGDHYATPAPVGFYNKIVADEQVVHNLEHGDVWITYKGSVSSSTITALKTLLDGAKVIITRRDTNDTHVAAVSWGRLDKFDLAGETISTDELQRLRDFILRYKNRGPESVLDSASMLGASPDEQ